MNEQPDLESLYAQAQTALKAKDYARASELLRQIVALDATYKDTSRLLANLVAQQRRRWYNDARLWSAVGVVALIALGVGIASQLPALLPRATEMPTAIALAPTATATRAEPTATAMPTMTSLPTSTSVPSVTPTRAPTAVSFKWQRMYAGQELGLASFAKIMPDPRDSDIIYLSNSSTGIYKTVDGGISWQPANNGFGNIAVQTLVTDSKAPQTLYAGLSRAGVYKTTDGGNNWRSINKGITAYYSLSAVAMDPNNNQHLFYATAATIYESLDAGENWGQVKESPCPGGNMTTMSMHSIDSRTLFLGTTQTPGFGTAQEDSQCAVGIYKSQDAGKTWTLIGLKGHSVDSIAMPPNQSNVVYATTEEGTYGSTDGGSTWNRLRDRCWSLSFDWDGNVVGICASQTFAKRGHRRIVGLS
jgi:hypothetical protein